MSYFIDSEENSIKKYSIAFDKDLNIEIRNLILPIDLLLQAVGPMFNQNAAAVSRGILYHDRKRGIAFSTHGNTIHYIL